MSAMEQQPIVAGLVSVIIPAYNAAGTLGRAVESVLAQTYAPVEIIIVNDGSTDATAEVCGQFGERIRIITQPNGGECAARNAGIDAAQGEFISFLDADDEITPTKIEALVAGLRQFPDAPGATGWTLHHTEKLEQAVRWKYRGKLPICLSVFDMLLIGLPDSSSCVMRASVIREAGLRFPVGVRFGGDIRFWSSVATASAGGGADWVYCDVLVSYYHCMAATSGTRQVPVETLTGLAFALMDMEPRIAPAQLPHFRAFLRRVCTEELLKCAINGERAKCRRLIRRGPPWRMRSPYLAMLFVLWFVLLGVAFLPGKLPAKILRTCVVNPWMRRKG